MSSRSQRLTIELVASKNMNAALRCQDLRSLSDFLGFAPQHIFYLVGNSDQLYFDIEIPKRSSDEKRNISVPITELKGVQREILARILEPIVVNEHAYAYVKSKSVVQAARKLCGVKAVLKADLRNFFPSINSRRVFGLFRSLNFNDATAFMLTSLVTYKGALCQGAPTSPTISNILCRNLDQQLTDLTRAWELQYLRYSDDLFFYGASDFKYRDVLGVVTRVVSDNGFTVNGRKTRYYPRGKPRYTLGLETHGRRPKLSRTTLRRYRAMFFKASHNINWAAENVDMLTGCLEWYKSVYGSDDKYMEYQRIIRNIRDIKLHQPYRSV